MPSWSDILSEIQNGIANNNPSSADDVRRRFLTLLSSKTERNTIIYATKCTQPGNIDPGLISISEEDLQGFMAVIHGLDGSKLDLIIHSPGGSIEAAAAIVSYLRTKFEDIRVIVPNIAMSAATMIACSSNQIVMGKHSFIGPIDPQLTLQTPLGLRLVPAQAIIDQFEMAKKECEDPKKLAAWMPILSQYGPDLLIESQNAIELSKKLVSEWLEKYMFSERENAKTLADDITAKLANHNEFKSHSYHINKELAGENGMKLNIRDLEEEQEFQDLVLSIFHATTILFDVTTAVKLIENHKGKAYVRLYAPPPQAKPN